MKTLDTSLLGLEWKLPASPHHSLGEIIRIVNIVKNRMIWYWRTDVVVRGEALKQASLLRIKRLFSDKCLEMNVVDPDHGHPSVTDGVVQHLPVEPGHGEPGGGGGGVEEDVHQLPGHVLQLRHPVGPRVHHQVQRAGHGEVTDSDLEIHPVTAWNNVLDSCLVSIIISSSSTIEGLPLRGNVYEVVGGVHPTVENKVCVGCEMSPRQVDVGVEILDIMCAELVRSNQLSDCDPLLVLDTLSVKLQGCEVRGCFLYHCVKMVDVVIKVIIWIE